MIRKARTFLAWSAGKRRLLLEALICLGWARMQKSLPFSRIAPSLGTPGMETPLVLDPAHEPVIREVKRAVKVMSRHTVWESQCLVRAIAARKMLERRRIACTLYLGTARDAAGNMVAHAWLRSGPFYVTGAEEMKMFTTVAAFGSGPGRKVKMEGA